VLGLLEEDKPMTLCITVTWKLLVSQKHKNIIEECSATEIGGLPVFSVGLSRSSPLCIDSHVLVPLPLPSSVLFLLLHTLPQPGGQPFAAQIFVFHRQVFGRKLLPAKRVQGHLWTLGPDLRLLSDPKEAVGWAAWPQAESQRSRLYVYKAPHLLWLSPSPTREGSNEP
jgi:hypothetical protein